jgi:dihydrofolate synthase/folylpolyglutamate synthase
MKTEADSRLLTLLSGLSNYERTRPQSREWSLENMERLVEWPELPPLEGKAVQIAGSKGKGTTALYLECLARSAGLGVGTYLSPHLHHVTERVRLDARPVSSQVLLEALEPLLDWARAAGIEATYFEALTAAALLVFARAGVDLAVFEVGLGGRFDATTAIPVDATILTGIELEHTEILGGSIAAIAAEKAAILRPQKPALVAATGEALAVVRETAHRVGAPLHVLGEDFGGSLRLAPGASRFEAPALELAAACLGQLFPDRTLSLEPPPRPELPGRFEVVESADGWPFVLDGAHTPESLGVVAQELRRRWPRDPVAALVASARGKAWEQGLSRLLGVVDSFLVTGLEGTPSEDPQELVAWLRERGAPADLAETAEAGVEQLASQPAVRLVTGSFYLVAAVRPVIC